MGGLPPNLTSNKTGIHNLEAAMSLYEKAMLAIAIITLIYDILSDLLRRRKSSE